MYISDLIVTDGQILELVSTSQSLLITFLDWENKRWILEFRDVIALESFSVEGEDLDSIQISSDDAFSNQAKLIAQDLSLTVFCYSFSSAWTGKVILRVVAGNGEARPLT